MFVSLYTNVLCFSCVLHCTDLTSYLTVHTVSHLFLCAQLIHCFWAHNETCDCQTSQPQFYAGYLWEYSGHNVNTWFSAFLGRNENQNERKRGGEYALQAALPPICSLLRLQQYQIAWHCMPEDSDFLWTVVDILIFICKRTVMCNI